MIRIVSGWSAPGGSTVAHIELTNLFNNNDIPCKFYGPHDWMLDQCESEQLTQEEIGSLSFPVTIHWVDISFVTRVDRFM